MTATSLIAWKSSHECPPRLMTETSKAPENYLLRRSLLANYNSSYNRCIGIGVRNPGKQLLDWRQNTIRSGHSIQKDAVVVNSFACFTFINKIAIYWCLHVVYKTFPTRKSNLWQASSIHAQCSSTTAFKFKRGGREEPGPHLQQLFRPTCRNCSQCFRVCLRIPLKHL